MGACANCCTFFMLFISLWGVVFLSILGGLYYNQSVGLLEDLPDEPKNFGDLPWSQRKQNIIGQFHQNAYNSWVAAGAYAAIAFLCALRACCILR